MRRKSFRAAAIITVTGVCGLVLGSLDQGFEVDNAGWDVFGGEFDATRVASGTNGVPSASGNWHAQDVGATQDDFGPASHWGGYSCNIGCSADACAAGTFPTGGYSSSSDIYLNVDGGWNNDTRFDYSSAINIPAGMHRRDFVFNAGFYNDAAGPGAGTDRFVISASNNAFRANSFPKNPGRDPIAISTTGWYTFTHRFYDDGAGVLAVDLTIRDAGGTLVKSWTLSDPTDVIGVAVGGNRYGWFANQEFPVFAFDNTIKDGCPAACCDDGPGIDSDCVIANRVECEQAGGLFLGEGTNCDEPVDCTVLLVTLDSISAEAVGDGVWLRWTTALEIDTIGFRVLRESTDTREKTFTVVASMIPAAGHGLEGASYEFLDTNKWPGPSVRYWLEDIDLNGKVTRHGPVEVDRGIRTRPVGRAIERR